MNCLLVYVGVQIVCVLYVTYIFVFKRHDVNMLIVKYHSVKNRVEACAYVYLSPLIFTV